MNPTPRRDAINALRERILPWYAKNKRDLPWRKTRDPYGLVVAEFMLQQTGVERVSDRWIAFLEKFPDWRTLASATAGDVIREWKGLGYNRRALNLHRLAAKVVNEFDGGLPAEREALVKLPGVGPYTAAAIQSFVFGLDVASIDVNLIRVIGRVVLGADRVPLAQIQPIAACALPMGQASAWNQALMDFAAKQCTPRRPACHICPLLDVCVYAGSAGSNQSNVNPPPSPSNQYGFRASDSNGLEYAEAAVRPTRQVAERQAPYAGSTRFFRGRIVDRLRALVGGESIDAAELESAVSEHAGADLIDFKQLLGALTKEGLIVSDAGGRLRLP